MQAGDEDSQHSITSNHEEPPPPPPPTGTGMKISLSKPIVFSPHGQRDTKRKKPDLHEVFNPDEDDTNTLVKKRKLIPLGNKNIRFRCSFSNFPFLQITAKTKKLKKRMAKRKKNRQNHKKRNANT